MTQVINLDDSDDPPTADGGATLSTMEQKVVRLVSLGCTGPEIAAILDRSLHTVINHKNRAMAKIGVHNAATLTRYALLTGISRLDDCLSEEERSRLLAFRGQRGETARTETEPSESKDEQSSPDEVT